MCDLCCCYADPLSATNQLGQTHRTENKDTDHTTRAIPCIQPHANAPFQNTDRTPQTQAEPEPKSQP